MWRPVVQTVAPTEEPLTLAQAKAQLGIEHAERDTALAESIAGARAKVEGLTGTRLVTQTVTVRTDCWSDLAKLPVAPVQSVVIGYVDPAGADQVVDVALYRADLELLEPRVVLRSGQAWPAREAGSLIIVTAVVGYGAAAQQPPDIVSALKILVADLETFRESGVSGLTSAVQSSASVEDLLANNRLHLIA